MNVPFVIYLYQGIATSTLGLKPAGNVANLSDFKAFEVFYVS